MLTTSTSHTNPVPVVLLDQFCELIGLLLRKTVGPVLEEMRGQVAGQAVEYKTHTDYRTKADLYAHNSIRDFVQDKFPQHGFFSEEGEPSNSKSGLTVVTDPLDGTISWSRGIGDFYCSCVALVDENYNTLAGVVYMPAQDTLFSAKLGGGAFQNGKLISCSNQTDINRALIVIDPGKESSKRNDLIDLQRSLLEANGVNSVLNIASSAAALCYLASGRIEAFFHPSPGIEDVAAAGLIASEAGAVITTLNGEAWNCISSTIFASCNLEMHKKLSSMMPHKTFVSRTTQ